MSETNAASEIVAANCGKSFSRQDVLQWSPERSRHLRSMAVVCFVSFTAFPLDRIESIRSVHCHFDHHCLVIENHNHTIQYLESCGRKLWFVKLPNRTCRHKNWMGSEVSTQQLRQRQYQQQQTLNRSSSGPSVPRSTSADHILTRDSSLDSNLGSLPFNVVSGLSRPIGAAVNLASTETTGFKSKSTTNVPSIPKEIVIVSRGDVESEDQRFTFPPPFKPLIPIGHESLAPGSLQINPTGLINTGLIIEHQLKYKADFVTSQQLVLIDIIKEIDTFSNYNSQVLTEKQKKFIKIGDSFSKLPEIDTLIGKISTELDTCLKRIEVLNQALPESERLEPFTPRLQAPSSPSK